MRKSEVKIITHGYYPRTLSTGFYKLDKLLLKSDSWPWIVQAQVLYSDLTVFKIKNFPAVETELWMPKHPI